MAEDYSCEGIDSGSFADGAAFVFVCVGGLVGWFLVVQLVLHTTACSSTTRRSPTDKHNL